jgi:large-conductance mechanosensitive channel
MALVLFIMLKSVNKLMKIGKKEEKTAAEEVPAKSAEVLLLEEIRDSLKDKKTK